MSELDVPFLLCFMDSFDDARFYRVLTEYITKIPSRYVAINVAQAINSFLYYNSTEPNTLSDEEIKDAWDFFYALVQKENPRRSQVPPLKKCTSYFVRKFFSLTNFCIACGCSNFPELSSPQFFKSLLRLDGFNDEVREYLNSLEKTKHFFVGLPVVMNNLALNEVKPLGELEKCFSGTLREAKTFNGLVGYYEYFSECLVLNLYWDEFGINLLESPKYSEAFSTFTKENFRAGENFVSLTKFISKFLEEEKCPPNNFVNVCSVNSYCFGSMMLRKESLSPSELEVFKGLKNYCLEMITVLLSLYDFYNETPLDIKEYLIERKGS